MMMERARGNHEIVRDPALRSESASRGGCLRSNSSAAGLNGYWVRNMIWKILRKCHRAGKKNVLSQCGIGGSGGLSRRVGLGNQALAKPSSRQMGGPYVAPIPGAVGHPQNDFILRS